MAAPKGNQFWLKRSSHGRKPIFESPDQLWDAACEYFQWCEENPLYECKPFAFQGVVVTEDVPLMRAMTQGGLCLFLDITQETYIQYRGREDFTEVTKAIDETIYSQKFSGAAAGLLNANIIARDLGLKDATSNEHTGKDGGPIQYTDLTEDALDLRIAALTQETEE